MDISCLPESGKLFGLLDPFLGEGEVPLALDNAIAICDA
jgi:hypothetical protein